MREFLKLLSDNDIRLHVVEGENGCLVAVFADNTDPTTKCRVGMAKNVCTGSVENFNRLYAEPCIRVITKEAEARKVLENA